MKLPRLSACLVPLTALLVTTPLLADLLPPDRMASPLLGVSLIELVIASTIVIGVLGGSIYLGVRLLRGSPKAPPKRGPGA